MLGEDATQEQIKARMKELRKDILSIARIFQFMTDEQLEPYERKVDEYEALEARLEEMINGGHSESDHTEG